MTIATPTPPAPTTPEELQDLYEEHAGVADTDRHDCAACFEEDGGCPGHCPLCDDPIDYCAGHTQAEIRMAAMLLP